MSDVEQARGTEGGTRGSEDTQSWIAQMTEGGGSVGRPDRGGKRKPTLFRKRLVVAYPNGA